MSEQQFNFDDYTRMFDLGDGEPPRAALVSVVLKTDRTDASEYSLDELERLLQTAGGVCAARITQRRDSPDSATYVGSGKAKELAEFAEANNIGLIVFDCELEPSQIRNLEKIVDVSVIDRTMLILEIFSLHARSREGKLQVEIAQLKYTAPRLIGKGKQLSRLGGASASAGAGGGGAGGAAGGASAAAGATRGSGESKLEEDRRNIRSRTRSLEAQLRRLDAERAVQRSGRQRDGVPQISIVGYTNAGKSTLLNRLTGAGVLAEDKLFATLDTTTRKFRLPDGSDILLTDTVGFIRNLPHHLIKAFKSTLEEAVLADALVVLVDASDPQADEQLDVTRKLLAELGAGDKPVLYVFNKCDLIGGIQNAPPPHSDTEALSAAISALDGGGVVQLAESLQFLVAQARGRRECTFVLPLGDGGALNTLYKQANVLDVQYSDERVTVRAQADARTRGELRQFIEA